MHVTFHITSFYFSCKAKTGSQTYSIPLVLLEVDDKLLGGIFYTNLFYTELMF